MAHSSLLKSAAASPFVTFMASGLIATYIRLVDATTRWSYVGREPIDSLLASDRGFILAFWHQRLLMVATLRRQTDRRVFMLISSHRDGEIIAKAVRPFGIEFIRGSAANPRKSFKNKGGAPAVAEMAAALKAGAIVGLTPDGPRGPARRAQPGIVRLAQLSGAPIITGAFSTSRGWRLATWDRFWLAAPFSRGVFVGGGPPIEVPANATPDQIEAARQAVEAGLNAAADAADRLVGRSPETASPG
jgi:lysophospholipid acyltransferase (LPLAT)-like uncharacterized protein